MIISNEATISASNFSSCNPDAPAGQGTAGNVQINASLAQLDHDSRMTATSAGGEKGNISLAAHDLILSAASLT